MLSKCANPACCAKFLHLSEGKLYLVDFKAAAFGRRAEADSRCTEKPAALEYFWLCSSCARTMTIQIDKNCQVGVVPAHERMNAQVMSNDSMASANTIVH
jgi:hypothetical protein